jgi:hypothetical protein
VRRSDSGRGKAIPFRIEPEFGQVREHSVKPSRSESCDVLHDDVSRSHLANDSSILGPEARPSAVEPFALSGERHVLTRKSASDAIHDSTPRLAVECGNIVPDRSRFQGLVFHPGHEDGRSEGVPLDITDSSGSSHGETDSKLEATDAGE